MEQMLNVEPFAFVGKKIINVAKTPLQGPIWLTRKSSAVEKA
jgi:hypothetical protein